MAWGLPFIVSFRCELRCRSWIDLRDFTKLPNRLTETNSSSWLALKSQKCFFGFSSWVLRFSCCSIPSRIRGRKLQRSLDGGGIFRREIRSETLRMPVFRRDDQVLRPRQVCSRVCQAERESSGECLVLISLSSSFHYSLNLWHYSQPVSDDLGLIKRTQPSLRGLD